ncbi:MAG: response regulator [Desulfosarcinaceae bacterium]|nr:response regulator [Desulfosarcinaceae bacterium]
MPQTDTPPDAITTRCPVSGLPILRRPEWTDLAFSDRYRFSSALIGDRIIYNQPVGSATVATLRKALDLTDRICDGWIPAGRTYVHLSDYRQVRTASSGARKYFIDYILAKNRLAGYIIFGASPLLRIIIKLGQKLGPSRAIPFYEVRTYAQAMDKAMELLGQGPVTFREISADGIAEADGKDPQKARQRLEGGRLILSAPHWRVDTGGFSLRNEVIDHQILHAKAVGEIHADDCELIDDLRNRIRNEARLEKGFPYIISDVSGLRYHSRRARQRHMQILRAWHQRYPIRLFIFIGANRMVKAAAALARPFMPFKLRLAADLTAALDLVDADRRDPSHLQRLWKWIVQRGTRRHREIEGYRDQLLQYLGDINWEKDGLPQPPPATADHPMEPVFEAIVLLKTELDEVFAERHAMADALKQSQQRFNEVMAHSRDLLFKRDIASGSYEYISTAAEGLLGYSPDELRAMGMDGVVELMHPEDRQRYRRFCADLLESDERLPQNHVLEYRIRHKDGHYIWFSDSHAVLRDEMGHPTHVIGSNRDIQRSKAMESERLRMVKRLQQSGKLEAVSTLAGGIAHNFNNLLMTILGNVEMARMQLSPDSEINSRIDAIQKAADRAAELSTLMLTYVGQSKLSFDTLDLGALVLEMTRVLKATSPHADQLTAETPVAETYISGDPGKIGQVITDVVTNAIEATADDNRQITLRTERRHCDAAFFEKHVLYEPMPPGEYVCLEIEDNGVGMDAQTLEKVFDPFFTTKFTGRGLGLAAAVGIIRAHQGTIALSSSPTKGTIVTALFPPAAAPAAAPQSASAATLSPARTRNTVLLVDDEPMVIEVGEMMLEAIGFDVVTAGDGIEALELLEEHAAEIALVILDLTMPRKDGFETFHDIARVAPQLPVIIATGYTRGQVHQQFRDLPPSAYLKKPFRMDHLADTIREVLSATRHP